MPITLALYCVPCHGAVTLQFDMWQPDGVPLAIPVPWTCPYCQAENSDMFAGKLQRVTKRHESPQAPR